MIHVTAKPAEGWVPKDYEERAVPLNQMATKVLKMQEAESMGSPHVFPRSDGGRYGRGLDLRISRYFKKAGVRSGGLHSLRHTYATRAIESGMDPESLRILLGHSDLKTTMKYLHVSDSHVRKVRHGTVE